MSDSEGVQKLVLAGYNPGIGLVSAGNMTPTYPGPLTRTPFAGTAFAFATEFGESGGKVSTWRLSGGPPDLHPATISDTTSRARAIIAFKLSPQ